MTRLGFKGVPPRSIEKKNRKEISDLWGVSCQQDEGTTTITSELNSLQI